MFNPCQRINRQDWQRPSFLLVTTHVQYVQYVQCIPAAITGSMLAHSRIMSFLFFQSTSLISVQVQVQVQVKEQTKQLQVQVQVQVQTIQLQVRTGKGTDNTGTDNTVTGTAEAYYVRVITMPLSAKLLCSQALANMAQSSITLLYTLSLT